MAVDIVIKNCKLVGPKTTADAGVAIENGKIVAVAADAHLPKANRVIDAGGKYVIPGSVDIHSHMGATYPYEEEIRTETQSWAYGGVTTAFDFLQTKGSYLEIFEGRKRAIETCSYIDFGFSPVMMTDDHIREIPEMVKLGITSFKFHQAYKGEEGARLGYTPPDDGTIYMGYKAIGELGPPCLAFTHCENVEIAYKFKAQLIKDGRNDLPAYSEARPEICEIEGMHRAALLAKATNAPLYVVHMSIGDGVDIVRQAWSQGIKLIAETCPHYLTVTKDTPGLGVLGKVNPPLRDQRNVDKLWWGIQQGYIQSIGSDHCVWMRKVKEGGGNIWEAAPGYPMAEAQLPIMLSEGVNKGRISLSKLVEICCTNPAKFAGLYPQKGCIRVGSDADLVIIDLNKELEVKHGSFHSSVDWVLHNGWKFKGMPVLTMVRGQVIVEDGKLVAQPGVGRYLARRLGS